MKRAFSLLIVIFVVAIFSLLTTNILSYKNVNSNNTTQEYLYTYAKFELEFYSSLILEASKIDTSNNKITFTHDSFEVYADIKNLNDKDEYLIDLFVKSKENAPFSISLHKRFLKPL